MIDVIPLYKETRVALVVPINPNRDALVFKAKGMSYDRDSQTVTIFGDDGTILGLFDSTDFSAIVCADMAEEDVEEVARRVFGRGLGRRERKCETDTN